MYLLCQRVNETAIRKKYFNCSSFETGNKIDKATEQDKSTVTEDGEDSTCFSTLTTRPNMLRSSVVSFSAVFFSLLLLSAVICPFPRIWSTL